MTEKEIRKVLDVLFEAGDVVELRVITKGGYGKIDSGFFDDFDKLAKCAAKYEKIAEGVYVTLNPCIPALLARAYNRVQTGAKLTTSKEHILKRRWIPIDIDADRPTGISSSNEEHELAIKKAYEIRDGLKAMGMPEGIVADSGNGAHVLIRINMPNTPQAETKIAGIQKIIKDKFDNTKGLKLDMFADANRIWKLYGTWACKGDSIPARPHRISKILSVPEALKGDSK
ncbi:MAG: hypothetical protein KKB09_07195 [Nanoarchaeota archaeon]|nr:hypothetical protein [Nanoarchaeota archaeon]